MPGSVGRYLRSSPMPPANARAQVQISIHSVGHQLPSPSPPCSRISCPPPTVELPRIPGQQDSTQHCTEAALSSTAPRSAPRHVTAVVAAPVEDHALEFGDVHDGYREAPITCGWLLHANGWAKVVAIVLKEGRFETCPCTDIATSLSTLSSLPRKACPVPPYGGGPRIIVIPAEDGIQKSGALDGCRFSDPHANLSPTGYVGAGLKPALVLWGRDTEKGCIPNNRVRPRGIIRAIIG